MSDDDWGFGPRIRENAGQILTGGGLPEYPRRCAPLEKIMDEHLRDTSGYLY